MDRATAATERQQALLTDDDEIDATARATFEPVIVAKRQIRLHSFDETSRCGRCRIELYGTEASPI